MSQVSLVIYGVAAFWALQSLTRMMLAHRRRILIRLQHQELNRREAERALQEEEATRLPGKVTAAAPGTKGAMVTAAQSAPGKQSAPAKTAGVK